MLTILISEIINECQGSSVQYRVFFFFAVGLDDDDNEEGEITGVDVPDGLVASELSIWIPVSPHHESYAHSK